MADDVGQRRLFAVEVATGRVLPLTNLGTVRGFDAGRNGLVYALDNLGMPANLFRIDLHSGSVVQFTHHNMEKMSGFALGDYQPFSFRGWNNEPVHGYLVKPVGFEPGHKYPVALLIHGGPEESLANEFHYRWNPQTFAGAGYAVVMIDFHGSRGYGQAFVDSVRVATGVIDPSRICRRAGVTCLAPFRFSMRRAPARSAAATAAIWSTGSRGNWRVGGASPVEVPGLARRSIRQPHDGL